MATLCPQADDDAEPVRVDVDGAFIAGHSARDVLDPVWWSGDIYGSVERYERCLAPFSREQRLLYALLWFEGEVDNGGFDQLFFNSTGIVFPDAMAAFQELGLSEGVAIMKEAKRRMGGDPSRDRETRQAQLDRLHPEFEDLDTRFYALDRNVNLDKVETAYIRAHAPAFFFHGTVWIPRATLRSRGRETYEP